MAKNRNKLSGLSGQLTSRKGNGLGSSQLLKPTGLFGSSPTGPSPSSKPSSLHDSRFLSMGAKDTPTGIQFGHPSNARTSTTPSGSAWTGLLKQSASGGLASALTGGLSSVLGLGGLVSGIMNLFGGGGKSSPPPLVEFQLPNSVSQTIYASSRGSTAYQGNSVQTQTTSGAGGNQASSSQTLQSLSSNPTLQYPSSNPTLQYPSSNPTLQYESGAIAQAVKTALLHSSSLNDVIAEI